MHELATEITIDASAERVWAILSDFGSYPDWNPFIREIRGQPREGTRLTIVLQPPDGKATTLKPVVLRAAPNKELRWVGKLLFGWIFTGEHNFEIVRVGEHRVRFVHRERFSGVLVPLMRRWLNTSIRTGFEQMNQAIKARAEATG